MKMPAIYMSHGAPPLLDDEIWKGQLREWSAAMAKPKAILVISAHWENAPIAISSTTANTPLIYDFGGFDPKFYNMKYETPDATWLGDLVASLMPVSEPLHRHQTRGLDHGAGRHDGGGGAGDRDQVAHRLHRVPVVVLRLRGRTRDDVDPRERPRDL